MTRSIGRICRLSLLGCMLVLLPALPSRSAMINISESVIGTGKFGGGPIGTSSPIAFINQLVTFTEVYDTANITTFTDSSGTSYEAVASQTLITVAGVGSGSTAIGLYGVGLIYLNPAMNQISLELGWLNGFETPFRLASPFFATYNLQGTFAPIAANYVATGMTVTTSFGNLVLTSAAATGTIGASIAVPEPTSFALLVAGFVILGGAGVRRRAARWPAA